MLWAPVEAAPTLESGNAADKAPSPFDALVAASSKPEPTAPPVKAATPRAAPEISIPLPVSKPFSAAALSPSTDDKPAAAPLPVVLKETSSSATASADDLMDMLDDTPDNISDCGQLF